MLYPAVRFLFGGKDSVGAVVATAVVEEVLKNKDLETGCTIHFVTEKLDAGPILVQKRCAVEKNDTPLTLKEKVQVLEGEAFLEAIKLIQQKS